MKYMPSHQRFRSGRSGRKTLTLPVTLAVASMVFSYGFVVARADDLDDQKQQVQQQLSVTSKQVSDSRDKITTATTNLINSQEALTAARESLTATQALLAAAEAHDGLLARRLTAEQHRLDQARQATRAAEEAVAQQRELIGNLARRAYQQRSPLVGMSALLGAKSPGDLGSRIQWNQTVFNVTAAEMTRLQVLQETQQAAEDHQATIEADVAARKADAEENVRLRAELEVRAIAEADTVAALVAEHEAAKAAAQAEYDAVSAEYQDLENELAQIEAEIAAEKAAAEAAASLSGFRMPVSDYWISSPFGYRTHPITGEYALHSGVDLAVDCGTPVYASAAGTVKRATFVGVFGNYIRINHGTINNANYQSGYAHLSAFAVSVGQHVQAGELIGYAGSTGRSTGCHLHLQIVRNGTAVNPLNYVS